MKLIALLCLVCLPFEAVTLSAGSPRFVQDRFVLSFWVDPPAGQNLARRVAEVANANFTVYLLTSKPNAQTQEQILDLCQQHGLKALLYLPGYAQGGRQGEQALEQIRRADRFPDDPALWGFLIRDEPATNVFPHLKYIVDHLHKKRPGKLAYINLFPDYASARQLGTPGYENYVRAFMDRVRPDVLCMDYYPFLQPQHDTRDGYCRNLAVMRKYALRDHVPFWNFFNTMPFGSHWDPTEAQLRWQIYTSLAYGAKGLLYFCYWTPPGREFPKGGAIITADGRRTRHYNQAKRINAAVKHLGPTLMNLTSTAVVRIPSASHPDKLLPPDCPIRHLSPGDYLLGVFVDRDGRRAVLLDNYSDCYTAWPTVEFAKPVAQVREVNQSTGQEGPVLDDSPAMPGVQISLDAGAGRLFLLPK